MQNTTLAISLGFGLLGLVSGLGCFHAAQAATPDDTIASLDAASLRMRGPVALVELLARYDKLKPGPERDALALTIDKVAQQRYATTSRLFWYTDIATAEAEATKQGKPILALRMLGDLADDWSCANSRLFRATLYANSEVSAFMRANFVLYWSSERDVPKVTIDMGDGRTIKTTITGNSAHYVLTPDGAVLDVLPGVYAPRPFRAELAKSLDLAKSVAALDRDERRSAIVAHHQKAQTEFAAKTTSLGFVGYLPNLGYLASDETIRDAAWRAQRSTMSKAVVEVPLLREISFAQVATLDKDNTPAWGAVGQAWWGERATMKPVIKKNVRAGDAIEFDVIGGQAPVVSIGARAAAGNPTAPLADVLDAASRVLVASIFDAGGQRSGEGQRALMIRRLEMNVMADSALNEMQLRPQIRARLVQGEIDFSKLNAFVYTEVFHTPKTDQWLGLAPRTDFTGLPGDGLFAPAAPKTLSAQR